MALTKVQTIGIETGISLTGVTTVTTLNASTDTLSVGGTVNFGGNVSIAGTLTYEDVTNIDSVGIITARSGINVTGGDVGIGLTNPEDYGNFADDLVIYDSSQPGMTFASGTSGYGSIYFADGTTGNAASRGQIQYGHSDDYMAFATAATERLRIDSSGRLLLGITSSAGGTLQVNGGIRVAGSGSPSDATSPYIYRTSGADNLCISTDGTERMRIDSSGRLLLGTTTEGVGQSDDLTVATSGDTGITVRSGTSSNGNLFFSDGTSGADEYRGYVQYDHSVNELIFGSDATARMRLDSSGRLLIGGTNTYHANADNLVVQGTGQIGVTIASTSTGKSNLFFADSTSNPGTYACYFEYDHSVDALKIGQGNNERIRIDSSGNMGLGTNSPSNDIHLKRTGADAILRIENTGNGNHSGIFFVRESSSGTSKGAANIHVESNTGGTGTALIFGCGSNTSATGGERMRIDSSGRLLINHNSSINNAGVASQQQITGDSAATASLSIRRDANSSSGPLIIFGKSRSGALGNNVSVAQNDNIGSIVFAAADGTDVSSQCAEIKAQIDGTPGSNDTPGRLIFMTASDGSNSPTERMRISANGRIAINSSSSDYKLYISGSGSSSAADQTLYMDSGGNYAVQLAMANGYNRRQGLTFLNNGSASNTSFGLISENTQLHIKTASYAIGATTDLSSGWNTQAIFDNAGGFYVGDNGDYSQGNYAQTSGNGNFYFRKDNGSNGGAIVVATNADRGWSNMYLNRFDWSSGDDSRYIAFMRNGQSVTSINLGSNGTTVVYNTGSDYRLKENIVPMANGIARVKQLQPKQFTMIGDPNGVLTDGFLAHEAQTVVPVAVTGTHNAMTTDEDGNEVPDYQGMDYGQLTPLLTAALQEAIAKIETLETKVAALEAAG